MINLTSINYLKFLRKAIPALVMLFSLNSYAQTFFLDNDTICLSDSAILTYQGIDAQSYYWNFCSGNLGYDHTTVNFEYDGNLNSPAYIEYFDDAYNGTYYTFVTNQGDGTISRNYYGTDPHSEPISDKLVITGAPLPNPIRGISIVDGGSSYFAFVVGGDGDSSKIVRINFGNSLRNASLTCIELVDIDNLDSPSDIIIRRSNGGTLFGHVVNKNSNSITYLEFSRIYDPPTDNDIGNPGGLLNNPTGIFIEYEKFGGEWHLFVANKGNNDIVRVDFGHDFNNTNPTAVSIGGSNILNSPSDITISNECDIDYGFITNANDEIIRFEITGLDDDYPIFESLGAIDGINSPLGISKIIRSGDTTSLCISNTAGNSVTKLSFLGCSNATPSSWNIDSKPPAIHYNQPGTYDLTLLVNEGLSNEGSACHNVVVMPNPRLELGNDTVIKKGASVVLEPDSVYYAYRWSSNNVYDPIDSREHSIEVDRTGTYTLIVTDENGCSSIDHLDVIVDIGIPNYFTPNNDSYNDTWVIPLLYSDPESEIMIFDRFGNIVAQYQAGDGYWDGTSNGRLLPQGTYWYVIKVPGTSRPYKGSISIKY